MNLFPAFLKLQNRSVLVVGGGAIAASKIPGLLQAGARVIVVAPDLSPELLARQRAGEITWLPEPFEPEDLQGIFLVVAATSLSDVNACVFLEAEKRKILCNSVDDIDHCHFYYGAVVQRGDLQIAISTNGKSPALAQRLRKELEQQFPPAYADWLDSLGATREQLRSQSTDLESTKLQLRQLATRPMLDRFLRTRRGTIHRAPRRVPEPCGLSSNTTDTVPIISPVAVQHRWTPSRQDLNNPQETIPPAQSVHPSKIFLIGAGPGDPDLLTVKALRLLQSASVVLHDSLVSPEILALIPESTQRIDVGKRRGFRLLSQSDINSLLIDAASHHQIVVRLKGGDPLLFGRAGEEIEALRAANLNFEIVPGISAAFGAAAAAQISLTDRRAASRVLFTTFSRSEEARAYSAMPTAPDTTVVVYMPGPDYAEVSRWLLDSGLVPETPCQVISKATQPDQSTHATTVASLQSQSPLPAPALLIVGRVAARSIADTTPDDWQQPSTPENFKRLSIS
jgi:uroporphyrin-III C-methyltransferase / precorrin-2 dehydrogenase / sirohydrochlorin ferrochelatase